MTTDQQLWTLIAACALVMIPFGVMLGALWRAMRRRAASWLPPRHLRRAGVRVRDARRPR
ncbi:cellulose biosynthesis protein BcsF [Stenotrophomonas maltophilia]